jgi:O-succinylbenzoic acid--CoA ligase
MQVRALFKNNLLNNEVNLFVKDWNSPLPYITLKTSGSTGTPKFIKVEKSKMVISAMNTLAHFDISKGSKVLLCLSPDTIGGKMILVRSIVGELDLFIGKLNSNPLEEIDETFDFAAMVPMQLINTLNKVPQKLKNIEKIIIGGAQLPEHIEHSVSRVHQKIYHTFGMTETLSHFAIRHIGVDQPNVYYALRGVRFSSEEGRLIVNYPGILETPLKTNELVRLINDKTFEWIGRADFIINSGGIKIIPEILESKLCTVISSSFFISSLPDDYLGQKVILIIESDGANNITKKDFSLILSPFEIPKELFILPQFIRTASGKINRLETIKLIKDVGFKIL